MTDRQSNLPLWPFVAADVLLLVAAGVLLELSRRPLPWWDAALLILCVGAAAASLALPFLRRNADEQSLSQARLLTEAAGRIQKIEEVAAQITGATDQWRQYQQQAAETALAAHGIAESMSKEAQTFTEFLKKAADTERAHLRLEVEKMRRAETEWLQIMVHILDHVFAVFQAAQRSGQPALAEQMNHFQNSCREAARRIGLVATFGKPGEPFDPNIHKLLEGLSANGNAIVNDTLATGYTFQGQVIRRPLVSLQESQG